MNTLRLCSPLSRFRLIRRPTFPSIAVGPTVHADETLAASGIRLFLVKVLEMTVLSTRLVIRWNNGAAFEKLNCT